MSQQRSDTEWLTLRLPEGWSTPESVGDVIIADGVSISRAGIASVSPTGEEVTGSAAALERTSSSANRLTPAAKAWYELLERVSIVEAMRAGPQSCALSTVEGAFVRSCDRRDLFPESDRPASWRHARSNGVAIHRSWSDACVRALWELAERERVLASWYGHVRPERIGGVPIGLDDARSYEWSAWAFGEESPGSFSRGIEVVGVFGFPLRAEAPLVMGFAARPRRDLALEDATREAAQCLGFLWGEPPGDPSVPPDPSAMGHLDFYQAHQNHSLLRSWLSGEHLRYASSDPSRRRGAADATIHREDVVYADLTPAWMGGSLRVAKAVCASARPLVFGASPFAAHLPEARRIHPIS